MGGQEYIDSQVDEYESFESEVDRYATGQRRALEFFFANERKSSYILDAACGDGVGLKWFKENGFTQAEGIELNPRKADRAKEHGVWVWTADMHNLSEYSSRSLYDIIWSSHSLEHCYDPIKVLKEFSHCMEPGGRLYLVLPFPDTVTCSAHLGNVHLHTNENTPDQFLKVLGEHFHVENWKLDNFRENEIWVKAIKR